MSTIVVAERSKTVRRMVEISLARHPLTLQFVDDAQSALQAASQAAAVIIDAAFDDGYALAQQIKATTSAKTILLVGRNTRFDAARGRQAQLDAHLTKPFLTQQLIEKVFTTLGQAVPDGALFKSSMLNIPLARKTAPKPPAPAMAKPAAPKPAPAAAVIPRRQAAAPTPPRPKVSAPPPVASSPAAPALLEPSPTPPGAFTPADNLQANVAAAAGAAAQTLGSALEGASKEVVERIAWEVIPRLAEAILKEEIAKVVRARIAQ